MHYLMSVGSLAFDLCRADSHLIQGLGFKVSCHEKSPTLGTPQEVPQWKPIYFLIMYILARLLFGFEMDQQAQTH